MRRHLPLLLALVGLLLPLLALAQGAAPDALGAPPAPGGLPSGLSYVLDTGGPLGALVYVAWQFGRGMRLTVDLRLAEEDRGLFKRLVEAVEGAGAALRRPPAA